MNKKQADKSGQFKLTAPQRRLFDVLMDSRNLTKSVEERCKMADIARDTYYRLIKNPEFLALIERESEAMIKPYLALLMKTALQHAVRGDFRFWKELMKMAGKLTDEFGISINIGKVVEEDREKYK